MLNASAFEAKIKKLEQDKAFLQKKLDEMSRANGIILDVIERLDFRKPSRSLDFEAVFNPASDEEGFRSEIAKQGETIKKLELELKKARKGIKA